MGRGVASFWVKAEDSRRADLDLDFGGATTKMLSLVSLRSVGAEEFVEATCGKVRLLINYGKVSKSLILGPMILKYSQIRRLL